MLKAVIEKNGWSSVGDSLGQWARVHFAAPEVAGRMLERELVSEFVGCAAEDRGLARGIQRGATAQQFGIRNDERVRPPSGGAPIRLGSLRAAIRDKPNNRSYELRKFKRRMVHCAVFGSSSTENDETYA